MTKQLDHQAWWTSPGDGSRLDRSRPAGAVQAGRRPVGACWCAGTGGPAWEGMATALAFPVPRLEVRGHDEIERRVTQAYAMFVEPGVHIRGGRRCRAPAPARRVGMEMVAVADGSVAGARYDVMVLDDDGRILLDHQHIAPS